MKRTPRITFLLPTAGREPVGGFKVVYEYANGLSRRDYRVTVVHPATFLRDVPLIKRAVKWRRYLQHLLTRSYRPNGWFRLDPEVQTLWIPSLNERFIPEAEVVVATGWQTAEWVLSYRLNRGRKAYLIQDYEHFMTADESIKKTMEATFLGGMFNISISPAVTDMLQAIGAPVATYIPNGIDFGIYRLEFAMDDPRRSLIGLPARPESFKGTADAIEALKIVRRKMGDLNTWAFGNRRLSYLPEWIQRYERPSDEQLRFLYNRSQIFVTASHYEGWGLTGSEAMACGAVLVSTQHGGVRAYAVHEETALLSPTHDPEALAANIVRLILDKAFRLRLAYAGHTHIQQYTWKRAVDGLESAIKEILR